MLPNEIEYDIYFAGGRHERPLLRRQSWPRSSRAEVPDKHRRISPRRSVGRALIGLGRMIASESAVTAPTRVATRVR